MSKEEIPVLSFNTIPEDIEAYRALRDSGIKIDPKPASEPPTPTLRVGFIKYRGLQEIEEYLRNCHKNEPKS